MKHLLILLAGLLVASSPAAGQDASPTRKGITTIPNPASFSLLNGNTLNSQMTSVDQLIYKSVTGLQTFSQFATYSQPTAVYDGSVWVRTAGTSTTATSGYSSVVSASVGGFYYQRIIDAGINVRWFGAKGTGLVDDAPAINAAIAFAKNQTAGNGGAYRHEIKFPSGIYRVLSTINVTNTTGVFLTGSEGEYVNVQINGNTGGIIFDFTGAIMGGCKGFTFISDHNDSNPSTIGVQFALSQDAQGNQLGGLNNKISNLFFQMDDNPSFNGGLGTIAVLNIRSEEFSGRDLLVKANAGMVFSNTQDLTPVGATSFSATSPYATVSKGSGSMGVTHISGTSIENIARRQPGIILYNANSFHFDGYISDGQSTTLGSNNFAIALYGQADGIDIKGTIETFPQFLRFAGANSQINGQIVFGTTRTPTLPVMDATNSSIIDSDIAISFNDPSMINNGRVFLYHAPTGDAAVTGGIQGCRFRSSKWVDNTLFISANLLKNTSNTQFYSGQPFEKVNNFVRDLKTYRKPLGNSIGGGNITSQIIRFTKADKTTTNSGNGGYYQVKIYGQIQFGQYGSGGNCAVDFESVINMSQSQNGTTNGTVSKTIIYNKTVTNTAYADITNLTATVDFSGTYPIVYVTVTTAGTSSGDNIVFSGYAQVASDFLVNQSIILD